MPDLVVMRFGIGQGDVRVSGWPRLARCARRDRQPREEIRSEIRRPRRRKAAPRSGQRLPRCT
jgi:hypothetical protein